MEWNLQFKKQAGVVNQLENRLGILNRVRDPGRLSRHPLFTQRTPVAGHGCPALATADARSSARDSGRAAPGAAGAGAEPRAVCRAWRDVVDGPSVWLLQLTRDRSAEVRALYALAQRCPAYDDRHDEFPLCALARFCLCAPLGRNLIFNACGERGSRGQGLTPGGGTSWLVGGAYF
ncbi:hypothetical protein STEG23_000718 [Scotinomys teguina]